SAMICDLRLRSGYHSIGPAPSRLDEGRKITFRAAPEPPATAKRPINRKNNCCVRLNQEPFAAKTTTGMANTAVEMGIAANDMANTPAETADSTPGRADTIAGRADTTLER